MVERTVLMRGLAYILVIRNCAHILQGYIQKTINNFPQPSEQSLAVNSIVLQVNQYPKTVYSVLPIKQLDECIRISNRGRVITYNQQNLLGRPDESNY